MAAKRKSTAKIPTDKPVTVVPLVAFAASDSNYSTTTRRKNSSSLLSVPNAFKNIEDGFIPYKSHSIRGGVDKSSNIEIRDTIILCQKAYYNFAQFRNVIDLMTEFSVGQIFLEGVNKKAKRFYSQLFEKINLWSLQDRFYREYYRSGNTFIHRYDSRLKRGDAEQIAKAFGAKLQAQAEVRLPAKYIILNPADIQFSGGSTFYTGKYQKVLTAFELAQFRKPKTEEDREAADSLPAEIKKKIKSRLTSVTVPLEEDKLAYVFYKKQDYEPFACPMGYPVLHDLNWKAELRKMDMALTRTVQQIILLVTMGNEPTKGGINQQNLEAMQKLMENESISRTIVSDYTTKAEFIVPDIAEILDPKKYEQVDRDINQGLNNILMGGEKFANQQNKVDIFIARLDHGREAFINDFLYPEMKRIGKEMGFRTIPKPVYETLSLKSNPNTLRMIARLIEINALTPEEGLVAIQNGKYPTPEESVESQKKYKALKDQGYYEPMIGGSKGEKGRPEGTEAPQTTKDIQPAGTQAKFSQAKIIENMATASKLAKKVTSSLKRRKKYTKEAAEQITETIIVNEPCGDWLKSSKTYIENPAHQNDSYLDGVYDIAV